MKCQRGRKCNKNMKSTHIYVKLDKRFIDQTYPGRHTLIIVDSSTSSTSTTSLQASSTNSN